MTKADLVNVVAQKADFTKKDRTASEAGQIVDYCDFFGHVVSPP